MCTKTFTARVCTKITSSLYGPYLDDNFIGKYLNFSPTIVSGFFKRGKRARQKKLNEIKIAQMVTPFILKLNKIQHTRSKILLDSIEVIY